ncbi:hypothetical protein [Pelosinus baikalensis]|uniref:Uncharacterized protein n=1 Tax=Pelosinus baikalensis TaxID=2892015 RepID=A0ABS8HYA9_9FIRM|nr:hypothetical protein [Pelosinus baikalensis]MCC5468151.1 hypothetical protein [Pelosinus baikalensis]
MRCLKYLSHIAMLAVNQITYWFGVRNECVCNECGGARDALALVCTELRNAFSK